MRARNPSLTFLNAGPNALFYAWFVARLLVIGKGALERELELSPNRWSTKAMLASLSGAVEAPTFIEILECSGEWFVRVVEDGRETISSFELESFALAYAESQRIRLGLEAIVRL